MTRREVWNTLCTIQVSTLHWEQGKERECTVFLLRKSLACDTAGRNVTSQMYVGL